MDLLGSILGNMEAPPSMDDKQKKKNKEQQKKLQELEEKEQEQKTKFRKNIDKQISEFVSDTTKRMLRFSAMNKLQRSIVHDITDVTHLISHSFGREGSEYGRYIMAFKKDNPPCEEELNAYKQGLEWDPNLIKKIVSKTNKTEDISSTNKVKPIEPSFNYKDKYSHIIGKESAKEAAKKTEANKTFGMVPSANKRDLRSVEQTMNELREKRRKLENENI